jgi:hypothetical protein
VPRQVRALARKSALNARARENALVIIDRFEYEVPKTSRLLALVERLGLGGRKVLVLTDGAKPNVYLSGRNLPTVHVMPYSDVSTYHVLWSDAVLVEGTALGQTLEPVAETEAAERPRRTKPARAKRAARAAADEVAGDEAAAEDETPVRRSAAKGAKRAKRGTAKKAARKAPAAKKKSAAKKSAAKKSPRGKGKPKKKGS